MADAGLVTLGETMVMFSGQAIGEPLRGDPYHLDMGGSESNVAIGVRRLGHQSAWIGRVGNDEFGRLITSALEAEQVDVAGVTVDPDAHTGVMVRYPRTGDSHVVRYWRSYSAGSSLSASDLPEDHITGAACVHTSGITLALSEAAHGAALMALHLARSNRVITSFDLNYRASLWSADKATSAYREVLEMCDIVFASIDEAELLVETTDAVEASKRLSALGPAEAVVTLGGSGAVAEIDGHFHRVEGKPVTVVDATGAGDAFVAGYLTSSLEGGGPTERLEMANLVASISVGTTGDWRGLPRRHELDALGPSADSHLR